MLKKIKDFIVEFQLELSSLKEEDKKPGTAFNLDNIRVVLICGYHVPNFLGKYSPDPKLRGKKDGKKLDAFFEENKEIKRDHFFILNADDLKKMYGPTFQMIWESILNESFASTTTSSTTNEN